MLECYDKQSWLRFADCIKKMTLTLFSFITNIFFRGQNPFLSCNILEFIGALKASKWSSNKKLPLLKPFLKLLIPFRLVRTRNIKIFVDININDPKFLSSVFSCNYDLYIHIIINMMFQADLLFSTILTILNTYLLF